MSLNVVHLLRHGEVHNPDKVLYGRLPGFRLSDHGQEQARLAAEWLAEKDLGYLVSSPLQRALETAAPLSQKTGLPVDTDERLLEAGNYLQGQQVAGGTNLKKMIASPKNWKLLYNPLRPSWGEPYQQIAGRMFAAALDARDNADGREAVIVSHQLPIVSLRRFALGQKLYHDPRKRQCGLASVTSLTFDGDTVVEVAYAEPGGATATDYVGGA